MVVTNSGTYPCAQHTHIKDTYDIISSCTAPSNSSAVQSVCHGNGLQRACMHGCPAEHYVQQRKLSVLAFLAHDALPTLAPSEPTQGARHRERF
eukprot:1156712-Pelagomonas_calceolata.AAC.9